MIEELNDWAVRPLDEIYAAIFIDAIVVKVRDGQVANRPFYAAIGVSLAGERDILGLWAGTGGEGAKFWMSVLTDLRNRGVKDVFFVVCDGLKGLPEVVGNVWPEAIVQTCIIHLIRNTFRLTSRKYWDEIKRDIKPIYTAVNAAAARSAFDELADKWGQRYPAVIRLWDNAWGEFTIFGVSVCSAKLGGNRIRSHAGGGPASACGLAGGRRLVRRYGNYSTDCRSLGMGSDRDLTGYRQGGLLEGPQLGYRGRTGGRRAVQSPRLPGSPELHQRVRRGRPIIQRVLGMGPGPQQHRRAEQGTNLMQSIRRRLPGRRLDM